MGSGSSNKGEGIRGSLLSPGDASSNLARLTPANSAASSLFTDGSDDAWSEDLADDHVEQSHSSPELATRSHSRQWNTRLRTSAHYTKRVAPAGKFQSLDYDTVRAPLSPALCQSAHKQHPPAAPGSTDPPCSPPAQCTSDLSMKRLEMYSKRKWYGYSGASVGRWVITVAIGIGIGVLAYTMSWGIEVRPSVRPYSRLSSWALYAA